jgi:catechol 2,3-dioxygenase-like lactoylglutathione lyase family enzyme
VNEERPVYAGSPTLCLPAKDLSASKRFYESLGFRVVEEVPAVRVVLRRGQAGAECLRAFRREILARFAGPGLSS